MEATIWQHLYWPGLSEDICSHVKTCNICQSFKKQKKKYGYLLPKEAEIIPWEHLFVDVIGPHKIRRKLKPKKELELQVVTMIDPAMGWFEIAEISSKGADTVANVIECTWMT